MTGPPAGPPPLRPFGLVLHHDGRWTHQGIPILNQKLRAAFDRGVKYLPAERVYVVTLGPFRAQIELEEAAFFVREFVAASGEIALSDRSREALELRSLRSSKLDGALLCTVKRALTPAGVPARFTPAAQALLLDAVDTSAEAPALRIAGRLAPLPELE